MATQVTPPPDPRSKDTLRLWLRLLGCANMIEREVRARLRREFDVTLPRFDLMAALHRHPDGLSMSQLSAHLMVSNGNVTGVVERLSREGMVTRQLQPGDRRSYRITLTDQGLANFNRMAAAHERWIAGLMAGLSDDEVAALTEMLGHTRTTLDARLTEEPSP